MARSLARALAWALALGLAALLLAALAGLAFVGSASGQAWLLARVPGLAVTAPQGRLSGGAFAAERVVFDAAAQRIVVERPAWRDLRWRWRPFAGAWVAIEIDGLAAERVRVEPRESAAPPRVPASLRLPLTLRAPGAAVGTLQWGDATVATALRADLEVGRDQGREHRLDALAFATSRARVQGRAGIGADAPFAVDAEAAAVSIDSAASQPTPSRAWRADVVARGPLESFAASAKLQSSAAAGAALDARALITPLAAWPLAKLDATLAALDLAALADGAPHTLLSGRADIDSRGLDQPVAARIALANAAPGRWDQGRVPASALELALAGHPRERARIDLQRFDLALAEGGRAQGRGEWKGHEAALELTLADLRPAALDARAPAMRLAGTVRATLAGLPRPDGGSVAPAAQRLSAALDLSGAHLAARGPPVRLAGRLDATRDAQGALAISLDEAVARSGDARAAGQLRLERAAGAAGAAGTRAPMRLLTRGELAGFDPAPWWPAWRGSARLSGHWQADLAAPNGAGTDAFALRGSADVELIDSRIEGVPLQAQAKLAREAAGWAVQLDATAAGNRIQAHGVHTPRADDERWRVELDAPALAALAPLAAFAPALRGKALAGQARGSVELQGRWPALATRGTLDGRELALDHWRAARVQAQWQLGAADESPLALTLDAERLAAADARARIDQLRAQVEGTRAAHRVTLDATAPLRPPAWTDALAAATAAAVAAANAASAPALAAALAPAAAAAPVAAPTTANAQGSRVRLRAQGRWRGDTVASSAPAASQAIASAAAQRRAAVRTRPALGVSARDASPGRPTARWQAQIDSLDIATIGARESAPWFATRELRTEIDFDKRGALRAARTGAGRATLFGAGVRWSDAQWLAADGAALSQWHIDAELEPLAVAPLLARWQPQGGFGGDLVVRGQARVTAGARFAADVVLERQAGDLSVSDDSGTTALGLTDLRLAYAAEDGTWHFTQAAAGSRLGVLAGAQSMRIAPDAAWPPPEAPMQGVLEWRVPDLAVWTRFTPPGWRVGGMLHTSAAIGGRFGAPEVQGRMSGSGLALRNLLQGVDVREGELALTLDGERARIERFEFKGGEGRLTLTGGATLGAAPRAQLVLAAERFGLLGRVDRRIVASGRAELTLDREAFALAGRMTIDEGLIDISQADAPALDADVRVVRGGRERASPPAQPSEPAPALLPREVRLALAVDLGAALRLRGRGLDTLLGGELALAAPHGRLAVNGNVRAERGSYQAYGQKLEIERGLLAFAGTPANPRLDILAVRPHLDVRVGVQIAGTAQAPRVRLVSEPEMSEMDKLSWLVLGRAPDGLARNDTALLQRAALALLAGVGQGPDAALLGGLGLDEFSLRQTDSGDVRDTVVRVGKQLSRRWYVGYERGVNATTGTWQLVYRVAQRFTLRAQSGQENALDAIWTWRWN